MKKLCFVICYFGELPNTMQITLDTCKYNPDYNWLLFTDDKTVYNYPENFKVIYCSFDALKQKIQRKFDFSLCIESPRKLCDYKPAYGYIFEEELKEFHYWGYCDLDQYFGNLSRFLTDSYLTQYDKFFTLGHMGIYPNNDVSRYLFMKSTKSYPNEPFYKEVFSTKHGCSFDEWPENGKSINHIIESENLKICSDWPMLDVGPHASIYEGSVYDLTHHRWTIDNRGSTVVAWDHGGMFAYIMQSERLEMREVLYAHIQKRRQKIIVKGSDDTALFYPNKVVIGGGISEEFIRKIFQNVKCRSLLRIDEFQWKGQLFKKKWKHRFSKVLK